MVDGGTHQVALFATAHLHQGQSAVHGTLEGRHLVAVSRTANGWRPLVVGGRERLLEDVVDHALHLFAGQVKHILRRIVL